MSSEFRTTLTATARELQDHRNLPYEAVRRAWWNGFWACFVWIVFIGGVLTVVVLYVYPPGADGGPAPSGSPTTTPTGPDFRGIQLPSNGSVEKPPGAKPPSYVNPVLPRRRAAPANEPKASGDTPPDIDHPVRLRRPAPAKEASDPPKAPVSPTDAAGVNPLFPAVAPN